jgi:Asp-tRNA(Asn)/Glu-tRNA(Gln) amidotransferase A subunit family amidase
VALVRETAALCRELGHDVTEADPEIDRDAVVPTFLTIAAANAAYNVRTHPTAGRPPRRGEVENVTFGTAARGERITAPDYVRAIHTAHRLGRQMAAFHQRHDVLLTPGLATPGAVKLGWIDMMLDDVDEYWRRVFTFSPFTVWFNITGQPAIMLPISQMETAGAPRGLPLAVQLAGRFGDEGTLFRLAAQLEAARPWIDRRPLLAD